MNYFKDWHPERVRRFKEEASERFRGENAHGAKLTTEAVREMRRRRDAGVSVAQLARDFGVNWQTAHNAIVGKTWSHVG